MSFPLPRDGLPERGRPRAIPWMLLLLVAPGVALPATPEPVEEILVVAARMPRPVQDVVGTVDVITAATIAEQISIDVDDVLRYTPGVSVARADTRFGATELTIRGLSGNRVTTLIDGVPVADQFDIGAFSNAGQDYLVPGSISRVEILRGPASTLFGSDAMGGVVAVITRDPDDYLDGRARATAAGLAWSGADGGRVVDAALAGRAGALGGVLHGAWLESNERDAAGTRLEDPLDRERQSATLKFHYAPSETRELRLTASFFDEDVASRPETVLGFGRQFANTTFLEGDDERRRDAVQAQYTFSPGRVWLEDGRVGVYAQKSRTEQITSERRERLDPPVAITRSFDYRFEDVGASVDLESRFTLGGLEHRLGWGVAVRRSWVRERRDGQERDLATGAVSSVLLGEHLPVRDFPNSTITESAVYLHDETFFGRLTVIPGVRFEHYRLAAEPDRIYREDFPDLPVEDVSESAVVPKLGLQWHVSEGLDAFVQYARGFRAPPFEDVNIGLDYAVPFNVRALPNPDLESETSDGLELGIDYHDDRIRAAVTLFGADYDDFIESKASIGVDPVSGALLFQSRNIERARVFGAELGVSARLTDVLSLDVAASWTRGENRVSDEPLNTVDPPSLVTRLQWRPGSRWRIGIAMRAAAGKDRVDDSVMELFEPDGYAVFDVLAGYSVTDLIHVDAGLFNVSDRTYWPWSSVRGRPAGDPLVDVLAAPGRYGAVSLRVGL